MKILISGVNNYLGRNVANCLAEEGQEVTCLSRSRKLFYRQVPEKVGVRVIEGDLFRGALPEGIDPGTEVAFYFNQSPINEIDVRLEMELIALQKFIRLLRSTACQQLIYVTKLADDNVDQVVSYIRSSGMAYTVIRISNIVGRGSALMNILANLARQPLVVLPREFARTRCQPIHLTDVCDYLHRIMLDPQAYGRTFDVGGPEVMTYKEAFERYLDIVKQKKRVLALPAVGASISVFLGRYVYQLEQDVASAFIVYMRRDLTVRNNGLILQYPISLKPFHVAVRYALGMT